MDEAIVVFSRKGIFQTTIAARDVRSREHARKLWPLVSSGASRQMVTWVSPSFESGKLRRRSHFRMLPAQHTYSPKAHFDDEEASRWRSVQESAEHQRAKELVAAELSRRLNAGLAMPWAFKDADASDYPLEGNLLLGADQVATEHPLETPFGSRFRLDVAVLGPPVQAEPMVLGGVEIELGHAFDGRKALIGKSLGFPLISIDITEMTLDELTPEWAQRVLTATTRSHEQGRRQTYIYLHDLLYGVSLTAAILKWLQYTDEKAVLVMSNDGFINWAWSSEPAAKAGAFFRTRNNVIPVPDNALASDPHIKIDRKGTQIPASVWFTHASADTPLREMKIHAEQYGVVLSLLLLPRSSDVWPPWAKED